MLSEVQEPCVPATAVFNKLLHERTGVRLADAAAPMADAPVIKKLLSCCGFDGIEVGQPNLHNFFLRSHTRTSPLSGICKTLYSCSRCTDILSLKSLKGLSPLLPSNRTS